MDVNISGETGTVDQGKTVAALLEQLGIINGCIEQTKA